MFLSWIRRVVLYDVQLKSTLPVESSNEPLSNRAKSQLFHTKAPYGESWSEKVLCGWFCQQAQSMISNQRDRIHGHSERPHVCHEPYQYNQGWETLFNMVMPQFGLKYRFKYVLSTSNTLEKITATIATYQPLDTVWWETNCYFVNGAHFPGINADPKYNFVGIKQSMNKTGSLFAGPSTLF